jgi:hypothetical protein
MTVLKLARNANTDGLINCLRPSDDVVAYGRRSRQPGQHHIQPLRSMVLNLSQLIKSCGTRTDPAAKTKSIGLPADASASWRIMVFASPSGQFYHSVTNSYRLSVLSHLDNYIVTRKSCPLTVTMQKHMPTPIRTATH